MATALIALGSNVGDRHLMLDRAKKMLAAWPGVRLLAVSSAFATRPIGGPTGQTEFLNAAVCCETSLEPRELLSALKQIERFLGRLQHAPRWSPRSIDLDLLLFDRQTIDSDELTVPHPRMAYRRFVVEPAAEIAPEMAHPTIGWTLAELRDHLRHAAPYVAIAGAAGAGKSQLAADAAQSAAAQWLCDPAAEALAASKNNLAGPSLETEIDFLRLRTVQLAQWEEIWGTDRPAQDGDGTSDAVGRRNAISAAVGDYWFDQALAYAESMLSGESFNSFHRLWQAAAEKVTRPKLLVLLDAPFELLWARFESHPDRPRWMSRELYQRVHEAIVRRAIDPGRGPWLRLDARQPADALVELSAAIGAMQ
jgi:2-amino-4-hydroxy-6-hydroxymethyldihydropteridine diphosphokinase